MYSTPLARIGLDQWCSPMSPVHSTLPVVGLYAWMRCCLNVVVCSPPSGAAYSTPLATIAEVVQSLAVNHFCTSVGLPALSTAIWKPAIPPWPVTNAQALPSAGLVHTAPCERMFAIAGKLNVCSSPPRLPGPPLPDRSARLSSRIFESLPGWTPRCGYFLLMPAGMTSRPPEPMSWSDLTDAFQFDGV